MKCFLEPSPRLRLPLACTVLAIVLAGTLSALAELSPWVRNLESNSAIDAAFFRMMTMPAGAVAFRRPPRETRPALSGLIKTQPRNAELYSLRALEDEQQLDFTAAESDWKAYVDNSSNTIDAEFALADFYRDRLRPMDEIKILSRIANAPPVAGAERTAPPQQPSWRAFERIFSIIQAQGLPKDVSMAQYRAWIARYPGESSLYARSLNFLIAQKEYSAAEQLIADYRKQFPADQVFPVKATAMVEYRRGSVRQGLSVYEQRFQPLWDPLLVKSYFDLLRETQNLRKFRDDAHAALLANPEDLNAAARMFYYNQQQGNNEAAQQTLTDYRLHKEASQSPWTAQQLYTCARLLEDIHAYPESARYYFALYNSQGEGSQNAQQTALAGLAGLLLTAPETPIRLGSGELSMYRDIATMDQGPGYLNGILSLLLNTTQPAAQYAEEEQRAVPYFHRSRAAELLALLDAKFPDSPGRAGLHTQLLEFYSNSGESDALIAGGHEFLANFAKAEERTTVALLMADAYARKGDTRNEFAIYDSVLQELAAKAQNIPLGSSERARGGGNYAAPASPARDPNLPESDEEENETQEGATQSQNSAAGNKFARVFGLDTSAPSALEQGARSPEYATVLERYLSRLVQTKQIPAALSLLSREIDRNPEDPGLYERLAAFLDQNRLGSQQEEVYRRALARFPDKSWYDKLARFYLRYKRDAEFEQLTRDAVKSFQGSELEQYFTHVVGGSPALYLQLNLLAHDRFPHNPAFVHNLLSAYQSPATRDPAAWEALLRQHWFEEPMLRSQFFEFLSRTHRLESELSAVRQNAPDAASWEQNPAAADFLAGANLWRSHFEESAAPLKTLAGQYPAETEIGRTASSVFRSLAYFEPADTAIAAAIEDNLLQAHPRNTETLARIGDIYADRDLFAQASPYWERIPQVAPGQPGGYLEAATIYWDYFDFDQAQRLLSLGRERLSNPNLYAYEAGAIYENQRDYPRAIDEYVKGALSAQQSSAELRLLQLASRPKFRQLVDQSTAKIAAPPAQGSNLSMPAVYLRVKVLEAQNRKPEMESFLESLVASTTSIEQAEAIETLAQQKSLETVRQHALEKQAALTGDPVTRMQLRYALIQLFESRKDFASAQADVEALYRENSKILGVVRATVDFYWRMKMRPQAIAVLLQAAKDAHPALRAQFTYEAARKSTEAQQFPQARELLAGLLQDSPYNGEYLAAMAQTYAEAGDDHGLERFYNEKIALFRNAPLPPDARKTQIATLRRGLIPALTRLNNYAGAVDQYIELVNNFPEDEALEAEAALYALRYQRQQQLVDFYARTVAQSPRDYRWWIVMARIQSSLENYPAAIDAYTKSIALRPDKVDLYTARAGLEERLMRLDEAADDYGHIYQLAYKDPQWMEKVAAVRARQGKIDEVIAALQAGLIDGRPENAGNYFEVARRLEDWGMLAQARAIAQQGIDKAGTDLLANSENLAGVKTYVRIMARLRQHQLAFATLQKALEDSAANLPVIKEQIERSGIAGLTDARWRDTVRRNRIETARAGMAAALQEMGRTVNTFFTPEERLDFAQFAESKYKGAGLDELEKFAIPFAESAALADQEARWRFAAMMQRARSANHDSYAAPLAQLQRRRGRFTELAMQMEQLADALPQMQRNGPWVVAADAYRSAGDETNEFRLLSVVFPRNGLDRSHQQRFFELLLARQPQELVRIASAWSTLAGEPAADYMIAHGSAPLARATVQARGKNRPPVWDKAYTALVGLYFADPAPEVKAAFTAALGDDTIGARLAKPVDRSQQLAGTLWFYYGSRYGEYLDTAKLGNANDFLPASLEESPATADGYLTLADYYAAAGDTGRAIADYNHVLELSPNRPDVYDSLGLAYYKQRDRAAALARWKQALAVLSRQLEDQRVPESFWADFGRTCDQLAARQLFAELKPDADTIIRAYLRRNGNYRSNALLHSAYAAGGNSEEATAWLIDLSSSAHDPSLILADIANASWIPLAQRAPIYRRILEWKENAAGSLNGLERQYADQDVIAWQMRWIGYLVRIKQYSAADAAITALPQAVRDAQAPTLVPLEMQVAAQLGALDAKLKAYRSLPQNAPAAEILRAAAQQLLVSGDKQSARKILELVFAREIEEHQLVAANFLGLAEIRIASGDTPGALNLLHRLVVVVGNPFENLDPAAALLEKTGHNQEAIEFLDQLVRSAPWDPAFRLRLAQARLSTGTDAAAAQAALTAIASEPGTPYAVRLKAANTLAGRETHDLGSGELNLLARAAGTIPAAAADRFYFYDARIRAAGNATDVEAKLQLLSHCVIDFPARNEARVPLFQAAVAAHSDEFALAVIEPLLQARFLRASPRETLNAAEPATSAEDDEAGADDSIVPTNADPQLSRAQRAQIAQMVGDAMRRRNRLADAVVYYNTARRLESAPAARQALLRKITEARNALRIQQQNAARQPLLHEALEQDRVVRPRLVARTSAGAKLSANSGGVQP